MFYQYLVQNLLHQAINFFPDPEYPTIILLHGWAGISGQFGLCSFMSFFCNIIKTKHFCIPLLYCYI